MMIHLARTLAFAAVVSFSPVAFAGGQTFPQTSADGSAPTGAIRAAIPTPEAMPPAILEGDNVPDILVSPASGNVMTTVLDGVTLGSLGAGYPFGPAYSGAVYTASGELNGDAVADIVVATGAGGGLVRLLDGQSLVEIASGYPFGTGFAGGVAVALGDVNGDGRLDVIVGQSSGGGHIRVFDGRTIAPLLSATPFGAGYSGGVSVTSGDIDGDGRADIVASQVSGGRVAVVSGLTGTVLATGTPYGPLSGGISVATGDVSGDGRADVVVAPASGAGAVLVFDVATLRVIGSFSPYGVAASNGVRLAMADLTADGRAEIITVPGPGVSAEVHVYDGATFALRQNTIAFTANVGAYLSVTSRPSLRFSSAAATTFTVGANGSFTVTTSGTPIATTLRVTGSLPSGVTFTNNGNGTATLSGTPTAASGGTYPLTVAAAGALGPQVSQNFVLTVVEAPAVTSLADVRFSLGAPGAFAITTTGFPAAALSLSGTLPNGLTFTDNGNGTGAIAGTAGAGTAGTYPLTLSASNAVGAAATQLLTLSVDDAPVFTSAAAAGFIVGVSGNFTVTTSAFPIASLISVAGVLPGGIAFTNNGNGTATLSGTAVVSTGGVYPLTFSASNGIDSAQQTFTLTVQESLFITSAATTTFAEGVTGSFSVTTSGAPRPGLTLAGALPTGVTFSDNGGGAGTLSGTPSSGTAGVYPLTLTASNGVAADVSQSFTLNVSAPPSITSGASTTFTVGAAGSFAVTSTGGPTPPALSMTGTLPSGVTFVDNSNGTAMLAGTPAVGTGGSYPLTISANNGVGAPAVQSFTLTVTEAAGITSANSTTVTVATSGTFAVTTAGFPAPTVTVTGALPSGVTFVDNGNGTATLAGNPLPGSGGGYALLFSASNGVGAPATQSFTLTVNEAPALGSGAATTFTIGVAGSFSITSTGFPIASLSVSGTLPAGVSFVDNGNGSASLAGTPATGTAATYVLVIEASNGVGTPATQNFTLTVAAAGPVAQDEVYSNGVGNTQFVVGAGIPGTPAVVISGSVLSNDSGQAPLAAGPSSIATTQGGLVSMAADGSFVYTPPVGFAGPSDTFTYTLTAGGGLTDTATVTINLGGIVWYVNSLAGAGDGRSHSPFNSMNAAAAAAQQNQVIYVHSGSPAGATALKTNQTLWGAGAAFTLNGLTIPAASAPVLQSTVTLANGVLISSLTVNGNGGAAIEGAGLTGVETLASVSISGGTSGLNLSNFGGSLIATGGVWTGVTSGAEVLVSGGSGTLSIGAAVANIGARSIDVQGKTGGSVTFSGPVTDIGAGIHLESNGGAAIAFTGGLALNTGASPAFTAIGGGTVTATQDNTSIVNTIATTSGTALNVANTEIGVAGLTFRSITAGTSTYSAGVAVILDHTGVAGANGGLSVVGNGAANSGGRLRRKSGADGSTTSGVGIYLNATKAPAFNRMQMDDFENAAIVGRDVEGFTLADSLLFGVLGNSAGFFEGALVFGAPGPGGGNGLTGTALIRDTQILGTSAEHIAAIYNRSGTLTLLMDGTSPLTCQFIGNSTSTGANGVHLQFQETATGTATLERCRVRDARDTAVRAIAEDDATLVLNVIDSELVSSSQGLQGVKATNGGSSQLSTTITGTDFVTIPGANVWVGQQSGNATALSMLRATVSDNSLIQPAGASDRPIVVQASSTPGAAAPSRVLVSGNFIQSPVLEGIHVSTPDALSSPLLDLTLLNNHVDVITVAPGATSVTVEATQPGASFCGNFLNNIFHHPPPTLGAGFFVTQSGGATFSIERGAALLNDPPATVLQVNNTGTNEIVVSGTIGVLQNSSCLLPSAP